MGTKTSASGSVCPFTAGTRLCLTRRSFEKPGGGRRQTYGPRTLARFDPHLTRFLAKIGRNT
jgi:hypothetical protein